MTWSFIKESSTSTTFLQQILIVIFLQVYNLNLQLKLFFYSQVTTNNNPPHNICCKYNIFFFIKNKKL